MSKKYDSSANAGNPFAPVLRNRKLGEEGTRTKQLPQTGARKEILKIADKLKERISKTTQGGLIYIWFRLQLL